MDSDYVVYYMKLDIIDIENIESEEKRIWNDKK